jgi:hypothetical protein
MNAENANAFIGGPCFNVPPEKRVSAAPQKKFFRSINSQRSPSRNSADTCSSTLFYPNAMRYFATDFQTEFVNSV